MLTPITLRDANKTTPLSCSKLVAHWITSKFLARAYTALLFRWEPSSGHLSLLSEPTTLQQASRHVQFSLPQGYLLCSCLCSILHLAGFSSCIRDAYPVPLMKVAFPASVSSPTEPPTSSSQHQTQLVTPWLSLSLGIVCPPSLGYKLYELIWTTLTSLKRFYVLEKMGDFLLSLSNKRRQGSAYTFFNAKASHTMLFLKNFKWQLSPKISAKKPTLCSAFLFSLVSEVEFRDPSLNECVTPNSLYIMCLS